jgi:hypothetical protein
MTQFTTLPRLESSSTRGAVWTVKADRPDTTPFPGIRRASGGVMIRKIRREPDAQRSRLLAEHKEAILEVWKRSPPSTMKDRVVLVEHKGDHVAVGAASARQVIRRHKFRLGLDLVDAIQAPRRPDEPFVVVLDWDGANAGPVEVRRGALRFRS